MFQIGSPSDLSPAMNPTQRHPNISQDYSTSYPDRVNKITEVGSIGGQASGSIACSGGIYSPQRARLCPWKLTSLQPFLRFLDLSSEPVYGTRVACGSAERIDPVRNFPARVEPSSCYRRRHRRQH
ncbi:hypothetical protein B0T13DRAFT_228684 [Neurospora crassa]|nr:hypothetical protein B0T13DRAFT_228684 [Neurospora crassa]